MTPSELANKLLAFYDNKPERWTKGAFARDKRQNLEDSISKSATCWCAYGAIEKLGLRVSEKPLASLLGHYNLANFNDSCKDFDEFRTKLEKVANS